MAALALLHPDHVGFPPPDHALHDPNGLLAVGGDLTPDWLLAAYASGIFPWFNDDGEDILWWSPDPRAVLPPHGLKISRSLRKRLRNGGFVVSADRAFDAVIAACAAPRDASGGTWITPRMHDAYRELHRLGFAHSVEAWRDEALVGGLYGLSLGRMFFGESMFTRERDASKVAFCCLVEQARRWEFNLIDCQIMNAHLASLGVTEIPRSEFLERLASNAGQQTRRGPWSLDPDILSAAATGSR